MADRQHDARRPVARLQRRRLGLGPAGHASPSRGTSANVQWNLEGGSITDLVVELLADRTSTSTRSTQIQVTTGGGDVSVQSSGLAINLVTKSGSNVFKGSVNGTFENDAMQGNNVTKELFDAGANGFLSGNPLKRISNYSVEYGGPIMKNKLWFWGAADKQDINVGIVNFFDASVGHVLQRPDHGAEDGPTALKALVTFDKLDDVQKCLSNDKTTIKDMQWKLNYQLNAANKFQYMFQSDNKYRNAPRRAAPTTADRSDDAAVQRQALGLAAADAPAHAHADRVATSWSSTTS